MTVGNSSQMGENLGVIGKVLDADIVPKLCYILAHSDTLVTNMEQDLWCQD